MSSAPDAPFFLGISVYSDPDYYEAVGACSVTETESPQPTPFTGFTDSSKKFGSLTICDWQCCGIYGGSGIVGDTVTVDGTTYSAPTTFDQSHVGDNIHFYDCWCSPDRIPFNPNQDPSIAPPPDGYSSWDGFTYTQFCHCLNPENQTNGHVTYRAINDCFAIVTESTGNGAVFHPVGTFSSVEYLNEVIAGRNTINNSYATTNADGGFCGNQIYYTHNSGDWHTDNPDPSNIFFILGLPKPEDGGGA
jgi:hypothetical protein